jgi:hypothetical protein
MNSAMQKTIYTVTTQTAGATKPIATEFHYYQASAEHRAIQIREQAARNGWNVVVRVELKV